MRFRVFEDIAVVGCEGPFNYTVPFNGGATGTLHTDDTDMPGPGYATVWEWSDSCDELDADVDEDNNCGNVDDTAPHHHSAIMIRVSADTTAPMRTDDPEAERVEVLLGRSLAGTATDAEREELDLYLADRPDLRGRIEQEVARGELGKGWLERVDKDDALARVDGSRRSRTERLAALGLVAGGLGLGTLAPFVGVPILGAGLALMVYSLVRVRLVAADPYKDIVR